MKFQEDIEELKKHLDALKSIGQLRNYLLQRDLRLVLTISTSKISFLDWDITQKKACGILHLGMKIRISRVFSDEALIETQALLPITFDKFDWVDQSELFETLKQGIKSCIKKIF